MHLAPGAASRTRACSLPTASSDSHMRASAPFTVSTRPSLAHLRRFGCSSRQHSTAHRQPLMTRATSSTETRDWAKPRFIQHKNEAKWFYRYLSIVYDHIVNPPHWNEEMRTDALQPAKLDSPDLKVVDVGGGTGFCTQGVVKHVRPQNVTLIDQSPDQLNKARGKQDLQGVTIVEGDAEDLPFATDSFDRYVSAGSIEYWPEPQRGIREAYRVIKKGGLACMIGPVHPTFFISRFFADIWMLFPTEQEYLDWFTAAGFQDIKIKRIGPSWYRGDRSHGLIMGCSVTGTKLEAGDSPLQLGPKPQEDSQGSNTNPLSFLFNFIVGTAAGSYYFVLPIVMWLRHRALLLIGK